MTTRELLAREWLGNPVGAWLVAAGVLALGVTLLVVLRRLLVRRLERSAAASSTLVDDLALDGLRRTSGAFLFVVAAAGATMALDIPDARRTLITRAAHLVFLLQAARWGSGAITFWLATVTRRRAETDKASLTTLNLVGIVLRIVLFVLLFLLVLQAFGVDVTALITGLGIAGVAVALAVQNILGDLLASLSIALDKPFVVGDFITFDAFMGTVEEVGLKTTRLRALSGEQIVISNAELLKKSVRNFRRQAERRVVFTLNFPLETPPDAIARVPALVQEIVTAETPVRFDRSHFHLITDQALQVESVYFVLSADYNLYMDVHQRINVALLRRLPEVGVALALPTRSVLVKDHEGRTGDGAAPAADLPPAGRATAAERGGPAAAPLSPRVARPAPAPRSRASPSRSGTRPWSLRQCP